MTQDGVEEVDLLVVGGGKAGKSLAMDRARAGWSVAMVEHDKIGGSCINVACIPTKSLVASARALLTARHAQALGIEVDGSVSATIDGLRRHKESVVGGMVDAHRTLFADSGMDFVLGVATFVAERTVEIRLVDGGTRRIRGRDVVVNTGTVPAVPDLDGLAGSGQARERGHHIRVAKIPAAAIPRSKTLNMSTGVWKAVVDADTDEILGVALLGHEGGEVVAAVQMAMLGNLRYQQVRDAPITHPTMAEGLNLLLDAL